jgi:hypothetical protein
VHESLLRLLTSFSVLDRVRADGYSAANIVTRSRQMRLEAIT